MALRVTQQSVDVLSEATGGKIRVTQFYVEVLGTQGASLSVTDTMSLTDSATELLGGSFNESASSSLSLTDTATPATDFSRTASSAMSLSDVAATATDYPRAVSSALTLTDTSFEGVLADASSAMSLTDSATRVFDLAASNALTLTDDAHESPVIVSASNSMPLTDDAISSIKILSVSSAMTLTDLAANDIIQVSSVMSLSHTAGVNIKPETVASAILLSDSVSRLLIHVVSSALALTDDASLLAVFSQSLSSDLGLIQTVEIDIDRAGELCNYSPNIGSGPFTFSATPPTLTPGTLTLFWPVVSPSLTIVLRNPEFGNKISFNANRINRKSRGGTVQVFRKSTWPKFRTLSMNMSVLTTTQADAFKSFLNSTLGLQIGLTDHEGRTWKGIISTPDTDITEIGPGACGNYATSFQFEGELA
jgi:hypothetical protein